MGETDGKVFFCGEGAGKMLSGSKVLHPDFREAGKRIESKRKKIEPISVDKWRMREHSKKKESEYPRTFWKGDGKRIHGASLRVREKKDRLFFMDKYSSGVLNCLYQNGPLTRMELMRLLKMRQNSIVEVCDTLEEEHLILKEDASRRRNVRLDLNAPRFATLGVEHSPDRLQMILLDAKRKKQASKTLPLLPGLSPEDRLKEILKTMRSFLAEHQTLRVVSIGFADAGIVDMDRGIGLFAAHLPGWRNIPLGRELESEFSVPCRLIDRLDAVCREDLMHLPVSELAGKNRFLVMVESGIGVSIFHKGDFWTQNCPFSGQLGHTVVRPGGEICHCGNRGCLETIAGFQAITERVGRLTGCRPENVEELLRMEEEGNRHVRLVLREAGETLGIALTNMVQLIGITEVIVLTRLWHPGSTFFEAMGRVMRENTLYPLSETLSLSGKTPDPEAAAAGAALFAQNEWFREPSSALL